MVDFGLNNGDPRVACKNIDDDGIEGDESDEVDEDDRGLDRDMLSKVLSGTGIKQGIPGATPVNTQMDEE